MRIWARSALLPAGWEEDVEVGVGPDGRIDSVLVDASPERADCSVKLLVPALSNVHSHSFQRAIAGRTERRGPDARDSFWTWRSAMYESLERLGPDEVEALAALAFVEMLEAGYASVGEFHYLHHGAGGTHYDDPAETSLRICASAGAVGIGLTLLPVHYAQGGCAGEPLNGGQLRFATDVDLYSRLVEGAQRGVATLPDGRVGIAPHSLRAVSPDDLAELAHRFPGLPTHIHAAEQVKEVEEVERHLGARPIQWLLDHAPLREHWCVVHATHMTPPERDGLARSGAVAGLCPVTEANLGDGIFPAQGYADAGGTWAVGTDSNVMISLAAELRMLEYGQRLESKNRVVVADPGQSVGRSLYDGALAGGALALGRASGALRVGLWADLAAIDPTRADLYPATGDEALDAWVFAARGEIVTDVWSGGRHVVTQGRHVGGEEVRRRWAQLARRLA